MSIFNFCIGNPPYQDETIGENKGFAPPIYHLFIDAAYRCADKVELIHPGRFLYSAGATPQSWNEQMLNDPHLKIMMHEQDSAKIFPGTDIKGGVVISYHDTQKDFGAIGIYTLFPELNSILHKVGFVPVEESLMTITYNQNKFDLEVLYKDYPEYGKVIGSNGKDKRFRNNIFQKIPLFTEEKHNVPEISVLGVDRNKRVWRYFPEKYLDKSHENVYKWKVLLPRANGSGAIGEVLSTPLVGEPLVGYTQSFIGIGAFDTKDEAEACMKYVKSKFARAMLGILKITQDNPPEKWRCVPIQNFATPSDIDWSMSVSEIDQQLYKKYGLDQTEIDFIESHVKEMT